MAYETSQDTTAVRMIPDRLRGWLIVFSTDIYKIWRYVYFLNDVALFQVSFSGI